MDLDTSSRWCCHQKALAWDSAWLSNLFGESDEARFEGSHTNWVTDSGRYLMKMVHNCSSNRQIGMILVAKCRALLYLFTTCVSDVAMYSHQKQSYRCAEVRGHVLKKNFFSLF